MSGDGGDGVRIVGAVDDRALADFGRDDIGNAERFIAREGENVRQTQRMGVFVWDGRRWQLDDGAVLCTIKAQGVARAIREEARAIDRELRDNKDDAFLKKASESHHAWARQSANSQRLNAMLTQALPHLSAPIDAWNARSELVCLPDGVLDLSSLEPTRGPHRREYFQTRMMNVTYDPDATAPLWDAFIKRVMPDPEIRAYLQRCVGSCLVDSQSDQVMPINHGAGANGKSTFFDVICEVFGDLAMSVSVQSFLANDRASGSSPQPDLVRLAYRPRLVRMSEPPPGARLAEGAVKEVTGGEPMVARDLHEKPIEFRPVFKCFLSCNNRPSIRGGDDGIWRRLPLIPWSVQIPPEERDPFLKDKLVAEASGILNWLLAGWADWRERGGLEPPAAVREASEEYRTESDAVGRFLIECTVRGDDLEENAALLHDAFAAWEEAEGLKALGANIFGRRLTDRGFIKRKTNGFQMRRGLALTDEARTLARDHEVDRMSKRKRKGSDGDEQ